MSGYERPTERGTSPSRVSFWATVWNPDHSSHGQALVSPSFGTQAELVGWVRTHRSEDSQVSAWRRECRGSDFHDERLSTRDDPPADPQRLRALLAELAQLLERKKRALDNRKAA